jgi:hypothetical protein
METDIGNPIEYDPVMDQLGQENAEDTKNEMTQEQPYYFHPPDMNSGPPPPPHQNEKVDIFANVEKSTWIIAFAVFLLGFFMGKTMQPVILKYS